MSSLENNYIQSSGKRTTIIVVIIVVCICISVIIGTVGIFMGTNLFASQQSSAKTEQTKKQPSTTTEQTPTNPATGIWYAPGPPGYTISYDTANKYCIDHNGRIPSVGNYRKAYDASAGVINPITHNCGKYWIEDGNAHKLIKTSMDAAGGICYPPGTYNTVEPNAGDLASGTVCETTGSRPSQINQSNWFPF